MEKTFRDIPRKYKVRIRIYDEQGQVQSEGLDFIDVFRSRKIRMVSKDKSTEVMDFDAPNIPQGHSLQLSLFSDKDDWLGEAVMGQDFLDARREYYDQCGLEFNMSQIWTSYFGSLDKREQASLTNGNEDQT